MSVSVFVQSLVSAWAIRSLPCSVKLDFRCPSTAQNPPPITTQSTSILSYHKMHYPRRPREQNNRQRTFPTTTRRGETSAARPEPRKTMRTHTSHRSPSSCLCVHYSFPISRALRFPSCRASIHLIRPTEPRMNRCLLAPWAPSEMQ